MDFRPQPIQIPRSEVEISYVRSSGPGGQNVNKTNTKAVVRWGFALSSVLSDEHKGRFRDSFASRLTKDGELVITSDRFRDQQMNLDDCFQKISEMVEATRFPPKPRKKTKPTKGSKRRRVEGKRVRSEIKKGRGRVDF